MQKHNGSPSLLYRSLSLLSTEELKEVLRTEQLMTGDEAADEEVLITIADILLEREPAEEDEKTEAALEAFWRDTVQDAEHHAQAVGSNCSKRNRRWHWLLGAAAMLVIGIPTAQALHLHFIHIVQQLIAGQFSFVSDVRNQDLAEVSQFQELLIKKQIPVSLEGLWLPDTYVPKDIVVKEYLDFDFYQLQLMNDRQEMLNIMVTRYKSETYNRKLETSDQAIEVYDCTGERVFYIFRNNLNLSATFFEKDIEFTIYGDISMEDLHKILDSIG